MDAVKRASFASKQVRAGPAPLASFEDLPSDELESPEEIAENPIYRSNAVEDESGSSDAHLTTPDSLTISSQSTPRIECEFDSNFTLTPSEPYEGQSSSELRTISLSSLSKESSLNVKPKKGSAVSLGTIETPEPEYTQRKSSWTDIFKSHNQNNLKSDSSSDKTLKKKSREELSNKDQAESKSKEKGKFLSFFKKKTNKNVNTALSPDDFIISSEIVNITEPEEIFTPKITNGNIPKGKENELPNSIEVSNNINIVEAQNDLGKINIEKNDRIPDERKINRKLINICEKPLEKEYNILSQPEFKQLDKVSKTENIQAIVHNIDQESSESELAFEEKDETLSISEVEKKEEAETDYEAETLLTPDISEIEEDQVIDLQPVSYEISKQVLMPSRQQRLEVTTKPIDRPRSTTPINAATLEAFIHSASPTSQINVEKIKLSLPGEQFLGRVKSPKKSAVKSWSDFCEKGLSPRMYKRNDIDDGESLFSPFEGANFPSENVPFTDSDPNWAAFESGFACSDNNNRFSDNFSSIKEFEFSTDLNDQIPQKVSDPYQPFETNFSPCSCECHKQTLDQTDSGQIPSTEIDQKSCSSCQCQLEMKGFDNFKSDFSSNLNNCDVANIDTVVLK
ncbi:DNA ligase 1 [Parasteatoda tepidariorum]|nr:uncharacterized protein LOC107444063 [Parasteatoda tepidariorum]